MYFTVNKSERWQFLHHFKNASRWTHGLLRSWAPPVDLATGAIPFSTRFIIQMWNSESLVPRPSLKGIPPLGTFYTIVQSRDFSHLQQTHRGKEQWKDSTWRHPVNMPYRRVVSRRFSKFGTYIKAQRDVPRLDISKPYRLLLFTICICSKCKNEPF